MTATRVPPHLVLANQIVDMQKGMDVIRAEIISKLDGQNMLRNFIINGAVPITHLQVVKMVKKLQSSIQTTIQAALLQNQNNLRNIAVPTDTSRTVLETTKFTIRDLDLGLKTPSNSRDLSITKLIHRL
jgi:hypothetical protein